MSSGKVFGELEQPRPLPSERRRARVCLIYTGGTIGMVPSDPSNPGNPHLKAASLDELLDAVPGLGEVEGIELGMIPFLHPVDSSDISTRDWMAIAEIIEDNYHEWDGFVVLCGTDTMAYTTSGLSFILNDLGKPVVVTGSQLPIKTPRTDAVQNLTNAIYLAGYKAVELPLVPEVVLLFGSHVLRGNRANKVSAEAMQGFDSPNFPPLGQLGEHIRIREDLVLSKPDERKFPFHVEKQLAQGIIIISIHPGITSTHLKQVLKMEGLEGVILMTYGAGNMPTAEEFVGPIQEAATGSGAFTKPIPILNVTQCSHGAVEMGLYAASGGLLEAGVTSALDLTLEAAVAKMHWAIPKYRSREALHNALQTAQRGEQSESLLDVGFDLKHLTECSEKVESGSQRIPGKYDRNLLKHAFLRIRGLSFENDGSGEEPGMRVFLNQSNASSITPVKSANLAFENQLFEEGRVRDVNREITQTARIVVGESDPIEVTIVSVNCRLRCTSIHLSLYMSA